MDWFLYDKDLRHERVKPRKALCYARILFLQVFALLISFRDRRKISLLILSKFKWINKLLPPMVF